MTYRGANVVGDVAPSQFGNRSLCDPEELGNDVLTAAAF
jgi:hypothetical protein